MDFRNFGLDGVDLNNFDYQCVLTQSGKSKFGTWKICDKSDEGLIVLQADKPDPVNVYRIAIEVNDNKKMRISVLICNSVLLDNIRRLGFVDYKVHAGDNQVSRISTLVYCEFGDDDVTQELARIFLNMLSNYLDACILKSKCDRGIIADQINELALKHGMLEPCFGDDWSRESRLNPATKAELRQAMAESRKSAAAAKASPLVIEGDSSIDALSIRQVSPAGLWIKSTSLFAISATAIVIAIEAFKRYGR